MTQTPHNQARIFISYARSDGEEFARNLRRRLEAKGFSLWQDRTSMEGGKDWWQQIAEALHQVEYMVLVMTPAALRSEVVRKEWRQARQDGVAVIPVIGAANLDFASLPRWMQDTHFVALDIDEQWTRFLRTLESPAQVQRVPFMAEDVPSDYVPRTQEFDRLLTQLLDQQRGEPLAITAALSGAGGYGKTTLAKALCHDARIQDAFHDGILWVTLGETPGDLTGRVQDVIEILSGERSGFTNVEAATSHLVELLGDRDILFVIDDVWDSAHLRPFLQGGKRCARLITTRNSTTLPSTSRRIPVDAMQQEEAIALLRFSLSAEEQHAFQHLATRLGEWPLLLKLVNATLRERVINAKQPLPDAISYVNKALDKRGLTAFDARDASERGQAVAKTLGVSFELLSEKEQARYGELAIFPEDVDIPLATLEKLWGATGGFDELDTEDLCALLSQRSLLLSFDLTKRTIRLHDVIRTYLQKTYHGQLVSIHNALLNTYVLATWAALPAQESYLWRYLTYHLHTAERTEELRQLLFDFDWIHAKLAATDVNALLSDYDQLPNDADTQLLQGAVRLSAHVIAVDRSQLRSQLQGRLLSFQSATIQRLCTQLNNKSQGVELHCLSPTLIPPGGPLLHTLAGHKDWINQVLVLPDGHHVISISNSYSSADHMLKVWDWQRGVEVHTLTGHKDPINQVLVLPDGQHVISASDDRTLKVWDWQRGVEVHTLAGHKDSVSRVLVLPDGQHVISISGHYDSADHTLKVWDWQRGTEVRSLSWYESFDVALLPDGQHLISVSLGHTLRVWNWQKATKAYAFPKHNARVNEVTVLPDGQHVFSASDDHTLKVWNWQYGTEVRSLIGHRSAVLAVATLPDGQHIISASDDSTLKVWDWQRGMEVHTLTGHRARVNAVAVFPNGQHVISASDDHTIKVWDWKGGTEICTLAGHSGGVTAVAVLPDGQHVTSASKDDTLKVWDWQQGTEIRSLYGGCGESFTEVASLSDGRHILSVYFESALCMGSVKVWAWQQNSEVSSLRVEISPVYNAAELSDNCHVVFASGANLTIWDWRQGSEVRTLSGASPRSSGSEIAVCSDDCHAVAAFSDGTLNVWNWHTGSLIATFTADNSLTACAIAPDGKTIIVGDEAGGVHFLRIENLPSPSLSDSTSQGDTQQRHFRWRDYLSFSGMSKYLRRIKNSTPLTPPSAE